MVNSERETDEGIEPTPKPLSLALPMTLDHPTLSISPATGGGSNRTINTELIRPPIIPSAASLVMTSHIKLSMQSSVTSDDGQPSETTPPSTSSTGDEPSHGRLINRPPRPNGPISPESQARHYNLRSEADYVMVSVVPTLLATLLLVMLQILTTSLSSMLPFRALGNPRGGLSQDSLYLSRSPNALLGPYISIRFLHHFKDPLPLFATLLSILSTVLVALSSEVIRLDMTATCDTGVLRDVLIEDAPPLDPFHPVRICAYGLRKSNTLMRIAEGLLVALAVLVIVTMVLLSRWKSGLASDPWSMASLASMINAGGELQTLLRSVPACKDTDTMRDMDVGANIRQVLQGRCFRLDSSAGHGGPIIEVVPTPTEDDVPIKATVRDPPTRKSIPTQEDDRSWWNRLSFASWEVIIRIVALLFTIGLLTLILHYETAVGVATGFEMFMNSQTIGVRILFAAFGTPINAFWNYYFSYSSEFQIHTSLSQTAQPARTSILLSPPSNIFVGLYRSIIHTKDPLQFHIALASLFAKFTPIVLSNIPFSNAVTWKIHEVCTWLSVAFLVHMGLVLVASFVLPVWRRYRYGARGEEGELELPVRSDTIAGHMFYLVDSWIVRDLAGMSGMNSKERDKVVIGMGSKWYGFGETMGVSGGLRIGVDYRCEDCRGDTCNVKVMGSDDVGGGKGKRKDGNLNSEGKAKGKSKVVDIELTQITARR